jgi:serine/threonine-protein kinase RsbW
VTEIVPPIPRVVDGCLHLQFADTLAGFEAGQGELRTFLEARGVSGRGLYRSELAVEELVVNVIRHASVNGESGARLIEVSVGVDDEDIQVTVEDDGPPFNPLEAPAPPRPSTLEDANIGGLGIPLVRLAAKHIDYERHAGRNRVVLRIQRD